MTVEFPFAEVSQLHLVFPIVPNYEEVMAALPKEYDEQDLFMSAASKWFMGTFDLGKDLPGYKPRVDNIEDASMQSDYIQVWANTFQPKHEEKIAVMGWLFSLAFEKA